MKPDGDPSGRAGRGRAPRRVIDVSAPLSEETEPWPGDTPVRLRATARISDGDSVNVARLTTSLHNGTHVDAPLHVARDGRAADRLPLRAFMGPAVVLDAPDALELADEELGRAVPRRHRVLLRWGRRDHRAFPDDVPPVPPGWVRRLAQRNVPLLGTDAPSVDALDSTELPAHRACVETGVQILENLVLAHVEPGRYDLVALPLRLEGADASPVRAVLVAGGRGRERAGPTHSEGTSS